MIFLIGGFIMNIKEEEREIIKEDIALHLSAIKRLRADLEWEEKELQKCYDELNLLEEKDLTPN
jgi:hypothetical protein